MKITHLRTLALATGVFGLTACSSSTAPSGSTTVVGVIASASESGVLTVTIATGSLGLLPRAGSLFAFFTAVTPAYASATASVNATATLVIQGGATIALTGTYDTGTHTLSISGGGYTFTGTYSNGVLSGTFTNPTGGTGGFTGQSGSSGSVVAYCGTFTDIAPVTTSGYWNITVNTTSNVVSGTGVDTHQSGARASITGTVSGSSLSGTFTEVSGGSGSGNWSMTISGTSLTGTWTNAAGNHGTLSGARC